MAGIGSEPIANIKSRTQATIIATPQIKQSTLKKLSLFGSVVAIYKGYLKQAI